MSNEERDDDNMEQRITGSTVLLGLFGSPVKHSVSPMMHNLSFKALGLDYAYLAFEVGSGEVPQAIAALKAFRMRGANVTMPCKTAVVPLMDRLTPAAQMVDAVNTIINDEGVLTGHITDGEGYLRSLREEGFEISGKKVVLLGAGGAATAICAQAALDGAAQITVFNRNEERARNMVSRIEGKTNCTLEVFPLNDREALKYSLDKSELLINATQVGMKPMEGQSPIPDQSFLHRELFVSDVIYQPRETLLLQMAKETGCRTMNGLGMVLYQGAASFEKWTGKPMPVELVKKALFPEK